MSDDVALLIGFDCEVTVIASAKTIPCWAAAEGSGLGAKRVSMGAIWGR